MMTRPHILTVAMRKVITATDGIAATHAPRPNLQGKITTRRLMERMTPSLAQNSEMESSLRFLVIEEALYQATMKTAANPKNTVASHVETMYTTFGPLLQPLRMRSNPAFNIPAMVAIPNARKPSKKLEG